MDKAAVIAGCPAFSGMPPELLRIVSGFFEARDYPEGGEVFAEGAQSGSMFVIAEGEVDVESRDSGGEMMFAGQLGRGEHIGALSLVKGGRRIATVTALAGTTLLELSRDSLARMKKEQPQAAARMMFGVLADMARIMKDNGEAVGEAARRMIGRG